MGVWLLKVLADERQRQIYLSPAQQGAGQVESIVLCDRRQPPHAVNVGRMASGRSRKPVSKRRAKIVPKRWIRKGGHGRLERFRS